MQNEKKAGLNDPKKTETNNLHFKNYLVKLSMTEFSEKRDDIKNRLEWSTAVWFNKLNGKTQISVAEKEIICQILNDTRKNIFND